MYSDELPDWLLAQDERLRRGTLARTGLVLALASVAMTFAVMIIGAVAS